jgi:hypothetical protein
MVDSLREIAESLETWLLPRISQAVEAGEVSVDLPTELQAEFEASRAKPPEESCADAMQDIAVELHMLEDARH